MTLPRDKHRFVTSIAELAQDIMRRKVEVRVADDGSAQRYRPGLSGKILDALYTKRLAELKDAVRATPLGCTIMDYLDERGVRIDFDHRMSSRGTAGLDNEILLKSSASNAELLSTLVHEARHIWQFEQIRAELEGVLPPAASIACDILIEADAYTFQQKFLEDYTTRTGNAAPYNVFLRLQRKRAQRPGLDETTRFLGYADKMRSSPVYTDQSLRRIEKHLKRLENATIAHAPTLAQSNELAVGIARRVCTTWPYKNAQGGYDSYIANLSDADIVKLVEPSKFAAYEIRPLSYQYERLQRALDARQAKDKVAHPLNRPN